MRGAEASAGSKPFRGFTLIELLIVIAIIGLLSSLILASLSSARAKAKDSTIQQSALQLRTVMVEEFASTGSYTAVKSGGNWKAEATTCTQAEFSGTYAADGYKLCGSIMRSYTSGIGCGANCLYFITTSPDATDKFSILAYLPGLSDSTGVAQYLCVGSSGKTSIGPVNGWTGSGCWANP